MENISATPGSDCGLKVRRERDSFSGSFTVDWPKTSAAVESWVRPWKTEEGRAEARPYKRPYKVRGWIPLVDFGFMGFLGDLGWSWELRAVPAAA